MLLSNTGAYSGLNSYTGGLNRFGGGGYDGYNNGYQQFGGYGGLF